MAKWHQELAIDLIQEYDAVDVLAAILELMAGDGDHETEVAEVHLTAERPIFVKRANDRKGSRGRGGYGKGNYHGDNRSRSGKDGRYQKDANKKKNYGNKDYSNKAGKNRTYTRDGKKSYKNNKKSAE